MYEHGTCLGCGEWKVLTPPDWECDECLNATRGYDIMDLDLTILEVEGETEEGETEA